MRYVILGASAAGINAAQKLRELDQNSDITMISTDESVYSRPMLHYYMSGKRDLNSLSFINKDFFEKHKVNWIKGTTVISLFPDSKEVMLSNNEKQHYDKLLIATGASSFIPNIPNLREACNVYGLRNLNDAIILKEKGKTAKNITVLGSGLVGIDAVIGLMENENITINIIELADRILPLQLDQCASGNCEKKLIDNNIKLFKSQKAEKIELDENNNIKEVHLDSGKILPTDILVVATGIRANTEFLSNTGIKLGKGIDVNSKMETSIPDVYAAGDVTAISGTWPDAVKQAHVAAYNMAGLEKEMDEMTVINNAMNFFGMPCISIGDVNNTDDSCKVKIFKEHDSYKKFIIKDKHICGAIFQGDIAYSGVFKYLIRNQIDISNINKELDEIGYEDFNY